jgi:mannitol-specific phosphotransferase system IIBC component
MKAKELKQIRTILKDLESDEMSINDIKQDLKYVLKHNHISIRATAKMVTSPSELTFQQFGNEYSGFELVNFYTDQYRTKVRVGLQQLLASGFTKAEIVEIIKETYKNL